MSMPPFVVAVPVYDGVNLMDIAAPRELFHWAALNDAVAAEAAVEFYYVAASKRVRTLDGTQIRAERRFSDRDVQAPDVLWVPGGDPAALRVQLDLGETGVVGYARRAGRDARVKASVCEGAVLLAATGLLDGFCATTHWNFYPCLADDYPAVRLVEPTQEGTSYVYPRYVLDGDRLTGGGVTSGLDEALFLIAHLWGAEVAENVAQTTQYAPSPPILARFGLASGCRVPATASADAAPRFSASTPLV